MDTLQSLRIFQRVAALRGFAATARELGLSPPVVTRVVAELEAQLGTRLLHRSTRNVKLTAAGAQYLKDVEAPLAQLLDAQARLRCQASRPQGQLRLAGVAGLLRTQVLPLLAGFRARYPEVSVRVTPLADAKQPDMQCDVSLMVVGGHPLPGECVVRRLATTTALLCAAPAWVRQHGVPHTPADLPGEPILMPYSAEVERDFRLRPRAAARGVVPFERRVPPSAICSPDGELVLASTLAGLGPGGVLSYAAAEPLRRGDLVQLLPDWHIGSWQVVAVMPSCQHMPPRTRAFMDHLAEHWGSSLADPWAAAAPMLARAAA